MDETIKKFTQVLGFAGISIFAKENWNTKKCFLIQFFNVLVGVFGFLSSSGFMVQNVSDLAVWIQGACVWSTTVIMNVSLLTCLIFRNRFRSFLEEVVFKDCALEIPVVENVMLMEPKRGKLRILRNLVIDSQRNLYKFCRVLLISYVVICFVCITLYTIGPIYIMCIRQDKNLRLLAFDMWFPWGFENFVIYVASFSFNAYAGYLCCIIFPGFQSMITLVLGQIIRQLRILTFILLHLDNLVEEITDERGERWQEECTLVLTQCVKHFVKIKRFSNKLNMTCKPFYLTAVLDITLLVCAVSVKINISDKLSPDIIKYYIQELVFILVNLLLCFLGQQVENECEKLEEAVTEKWYIYNRKHRINVQIFKTALSQGMPIYIFGTVTLSLVTFTWFIKTGMSFFTLMMSVLEG